MLNKVVLTVFKPVEIDQFKAGAILNKVVLIGRLTKEPELRYILRG